MKPLAFGSNIIHCISSKDKGQFFTATVSSHSIRTILVLVSCFRVYKYCESDKTPLRCWVGDLAAKLGRLNVAGKILDLSSTKKFFTDSNLPLSGEASIIGHSIVVHDDHAPEHRGERMACTPIRRLYRHKACIRAKRAIGVRSSSEEYKTILYIGPTGRFSKDLFSGRGSRMVW